MAIYKKEDPPSEGTEFKELNEFKLQLQKVKSHINKEIGNYPSPIPACDAQFNYLLEERSKISVALKQVDNLLRKCQTEIVELEAIEEIIKTSNQIDDSMAARLIAAFRRTKC